MGRSLKITVNSARDLYNADADEGGESDPYVIVCFDNKVDQELARTETISETTSPEWNQTFDVDITKHMKALADEGEDEPKMITFCVYDGDAGESEPLGVAGISFDRLVKEGKVEGDLEVYQGSGTINASVEMKKVKVGSMLTSDAALKIGGGVVGAAALGAIGTYLYKRHNQKKNKLTEQNEDVDPDTLRTGMAYGYNVEDDDDEDDDKGNMKKWWEMDDEESGDEDDNRWTDDVYQ